MSLPSPAQVLPHAPPMVWLDAVVASDDHTTTASVTPRPDHPLAEAHGIPAMAVVEWIAQAAAVHAGLRRHRAGLPPEPGVITSCRGLSWTVPAFAFGQTITVTVTCLHGADDALAAFDGQVQLHDQVVASGRVHVLRGAATTPTQESP